MLEHEINELLKKHTFLKQARNGYKYIITGPYAFKANIKGQIVNDCFEVEVSFGEDYKQNLPVVKEIGGRIAKDVDKNHINGDGTCCLGIDHAVKKLLGPNFTLLDFFNIAMTNYFAQYSLKEKLGYWPNGESAHFTQGIIDYYLESFKLKDLNGVIKFLQDLVNMKKLPKGFQKCNCGCNKLVKNCPYQKKLKKAFIVGHDYKKELQQLENYIGG